MRICFLAAANSIHSVRWIKFFADRGHEIIWVSLAPPIPEAKELVKKVNFHEITPSPLVDLNGWLAIRHLPVTIKQIKKIIRREKPDLLHVHSAGTYGLAGALTDFHPIVLTPWGSDILLNAGLKLRLVKFVVGRADAYTCDGNNTSAKLVELGAKKEKIAFIRFGTDIDKFKPRNRGGTGAKEIKIISLRSLVSIYDIETLIRAAAETIKKFPEAKFLLVGEGVEQKRLEKLSRDLELGKNIKFLGKVTNEKLPEILQSADIYISTALSDSGLSASTAEAMASGLPAVVTATGDNKEWIDERFVIPAKSPIILAEKIISLISDKELRLSQGKRNRGIIEEKNNYSREMAKVEKIYEEIIKRR